MILLIDIGNSRVKWAIQAQNTLEFKGALAYEKGMIERALPPIFSSMNRPEAIRICSVANSTTNEALTEWFKSVWGVTPAFAKSEFKFGELTNAYSIPSTLGVDRWCAMIAARQVVPHQACMVIDAGTAMTVDVIDAQGFHRGGFIVPGISLMQRSLDLSTDLVETISEAQIEPLLATNTKDAVHSGSLYMLASYVERLFKDMSKELKEEPMVLITGGDRKKIADLLSIKVKECPELIFEGLKGSFEAQN